MKKKFFQVILTFTLISCDKGKSSDEDEPPSLSLISSGPSEQGTDHYAVFTFASSEADSFLCGLASDGELLPCTSPHSVMFLQPGDHRFIVRALAEPDVTLGQDQYTWRIDSIFTAGHSALENHGNIPDPDPHGASFRIKCDFSHANYDDPIIFPGRTGRSHLHMYFGNAQTDANSSLASIVTSGNSTCDGNPLNRSSYWVPALLAPIYDEDGNHQTTGSEPQFRYVLPLGEEFAPDIYYKSGVDDLSVIEPMPPGLRMISGRATASPDNPQSTNVVRWSCSNETLADGNDPKLLSIPRCRPDSSDEPVNLVLSIFFPSCWDGQNLYDTSQNHMAYPEAFESSEGANDWSIRCPDTHPVTLTVVSYNFLFPVTEENVSPQGDTRGWRLSSDSYEVSLSDPNRNGGYSAHGDWFMAWHPELQDQLIENCIKNGLDCSSGDIGNGWRMIGRATGEKTMPAIKLSAGKDHSDHHLH